LDAKLNELFDRLSKKLPARQEAADDPGDVEAPASYPVEQ
jgi:hypothetical protein